MRWFKNDYAGQQDGVNEYGVPYIAGQSVENAVRGADWKDQTLSDDSVQGAVSDYGAVLAAMGFSSVEEMIAAANQL